MDEKLREPEDDISAGYVQKRQIIHELNSPAMDLLQRYGAAVDTRKKEPPGPEPVEGAEIDVKKVSIMTSEELELNKEFIADLRSRGESDEEIKEKLKSIEADPWIDPIAAFSAAFGGSYYNALKRGGMKLFPALTRAITAGTVGGAADIPLGAGAEKVAGKYPQLAFPFAIATGMISGMTVENAIEKSVIRALAKGGKKASKELIEETVSKVRKNLKSNIVEDDITASVVKDLNKEFTETVRELPSRGIVARTKTNKKILESDSDWIAGKDNGSQKAADRFADKFWTGKETEKLVKELENPANTIFISMPSSSRNNMHPISLAEKISKDLGGEFIKGDEFFDPIHKQASKDILPSERVYFPRIFEPKNIEVLRYKTKGKEVVIIDDIFSSGGSAAVFINTLKRNGINVKTIAGYFGTTKLQVDPATLSKLNTALKQAGITIKARDLANVLTMKEVRLSIIPEINKARTEDARKELTQRLQRLFDQRSLEGMGSDQTWRYPGGRPGEEDLGHVGAFERVPPGTGPPGISPSELDARLVETLGDSTKPLVQIIKEAPSKTKVFLETDLTDLPEKAININLSRIETADDVKEALAKTAEIFGPEIRTARRGYQSNIQTEKLADLIGMSPEQLLKRRRGEAFSAEQAVAARKMLISSGEELTTMAKKIKLGMATDIDKFAFQKMLATHYAIQAQVSGMTAEAGRALQSFKIMAKSSEGKVRQIKDLMNSIKKGPVSTEKMAAMLSDIDTAEGVNTFVKQVKKATTFDMVIEAWINGLLSGPQTHAVNTMSNTLVAFWQIPERLTAAGIGRIMPGKQEITEMEALAQSFGLIEGFKDGLKAFVKTMKAGEPVDVLSKIETRRFRAITAENVGLEQGGIAGTAVDLLGEGIRLPGRFLMAEDEFFKGIGYRMELRARAFRQARMENLEGDLAARRIQEIINDPPDDIHLAAVDATHYQTFTKELGEAGRSFQRILTKLPALRFIVPFVRTPTNIVKFMGERTPLAPLSKNVRAEIAAGGARRDLALAKISLGSMVMAVTAYMATSGYITGGGPSDPKLKSIKRNTGWQPYSVRIGDKYYSYSRLEPLGMLLGVSADMAEIVGQLDDTDAKKLVTAAVIGFSKNITSKTWLRGLSETIRTFDDPDRYGKRWIENYARSLVPTGVAQIERIIDPEVQSVYGIMDSIKSRIPGYSKDLPPRRNLWGEPIVLEGGLGPDIVSPIYTSTARKSPIDEELLRIRIPISMPKRTQNFRGESINLEPKEYDRYLVLMNTLPMPQTGKNLKETLDFLVTKDTTYQNANDDKKEMMIRGYIIQAKDMARTALYDESAEIQWLVDQLQMEKMMVQ